jgi:hypothetical protein
MMAISGFKKEIPDYMLLWKTHNFTPAENAQWSLLRALEWGNWPFFITQPIAPILFIFYPWWTVLLGVVLLDWIWAVIRHKFVSPFLASVGLWFVRLKWVVCPVVCIYFLYQHIYFVAVLSLFYPVVNVLLMNLAPRGGQIEILQSIFMTGVAKNEVEAVSRWHKAADQGHANARLRLGIAYARGNGVPQDYSEAYFWLFLAEVGEPRYFKQEELAKERDNVMSHLTLDDLFHEQERVQKWLKAHQAVLQ